MIANGKYVNADQVKASNIHQYIQKIGFTNIWEKDSFRISDTETIRGRLYVGKKTIQYRVYSSKDDNVGRNAYKDVYGIFLMDFDNETNMKYLLANFNIDDIEEYYNNISQDIDEYVDSYIGSNPSNYDSCFWVTGYSIAGGIASHVSPYLIGKSETYTYTFGAPNTTQDGSTSNANIKNIINEDDLIPKVINRDEGYSRVGALYNDSIYDNLQLEYRKFIGNLKDYQVSPKTTNTLKNKIKQAKGNVTYENFKNMLTNGMAKYFSNYNKINSSFNHRLSASESKLSTDLKELLNNNVDKVKKAHEIKAYYTLVKSLNGFDLNNYDVGWTEIDNEVESNNIEQDDEYEHMYIEIDWEIGYPPNKEQIEKVAESFKRHNIILHIDAGEYSVNYSEKEIQKYGTQYNLISGLPSLFYTLQLGTDRNLIEEIVEQNFSKREKFRYCMYLRELKHPPQYPSNGSLRGIADDIDGRIFILSKSVISSGSIRYPNTESAVFMHEFGHTLGLHHGGDDDINYKPNYVSIMNYLYCNYGGLIANYDIDYSEYEFPEMKLNHIDERKGIDPHNIGKNIKGIKWFLSGDDLRNPPNFKNYEDENRSIDFNKINGIETDVSIYFYSEDDLRYYKKSINDWKVVIRHLLPKANVNYDTFNYDIYGEGIY